MKVEFKGLKDVIETIEDIADAADMAQAITTACMLVEAEAKKKAPKIDGDLRRSITSKVDITPTGIEGAVYSPLEYAPYVEYGTGLFSIHPMGGRSDVPWVYKDERTGKFITTYGQHPQPYLNPALEDNRGQILRLIKGAFLNG